MRRICARLVVAALVACAASSQDPKPQPSKAPEFEALAASWLTSDQTDADAKARVVDAMLAQRKDAFPWLRNQLLAATDAASPGATGLRSLFTDVVLGFVEQQRRSGVVYRGPIEDLQGQYLFADFVSGNLWSASITSLAPGSVLPATSLTSRNTAFAPDVGTVNSIVNFGTDIEGNVYIVDIGGEIFRLEPLP